MTRRISITLTLASLVLAGTLLDAQNGKTLEAEFKAAQWKADVEGDLKGAIKGFEKIAESKNVDPSLAAKALLAIGDSQRKLRKDVEARKAYEEVVGKYSGTPLAAEAKRRLATIPSGTVSGLTPRLVCSDCAGSADPYFVSDDGRWVTFFEYYTFGVREIASGKVIRPLERRSNDFGVPLFPVLSRDARQIAYQWIPTESAPNPASMIAIENLIAERSSDFESLVAAMNQTNAMSQALNRTAPVLRVIGNQADGQPRTLVNDPALSRIVPRAWSPDGKSILVMQWKSNEIAQMAWVSVADGKITPLTVLGRRAETGAATTAGPPGISPDGKWIAFSALASDPSSSDTQRTRGQHIYIISASGGPEVAAVTGANTNRSPVWTPDGKSILFISNRSGSFGLWSVPVANGRAIGPAVLLKQDLGNVRALGMKSGDSYYFYKEGANRDPQMIEIRKKEKGNAAQKTTGDTRSFPGFDFLWSPDGAYLAFRRQTEGNAHSLFVYSLKTGEERRYDSPSRALSPVGKRWLNAGDALLQVMQDADGKRSLYRVDLKTGVFKLVSSPFGHIPNGLSPNDRTLFYANDPDRLMAIDLTTMEQRQVAVVEGLLERESEITVAPDNRTLHLKTCRQSGSRGIRGGGQMPMYECKNIVAVDIMTGQQTKLFTASEDDLISHFAFSPDMRQMAVIVNNQDSTRFRLLLMRADGKDIHDLGQHEPGGRIQSVWGPFWSPDGASITVRRMVGALDLFTERLQISVDGRHSGWQPFTDAGLSPDGAHVASEVDRPSITVREVWALDNVSAFLKTAR